jgi:hypothetical protein
MEPQGSGSASSYPGTEKLRDEQLRCATTALEAPMSGLDEIERETER